MLCKLFTGESLTHREPALDENDFERYLKSLFPLMLPERDVLWVLACRTDTNAKKNKASSQKERVQISIFPFGLRPEKDGAVWLLPNPAWHRELAKPRTHVPVLQGQDSQKTCEVQKVCGPRLSALLFSGEKRARALAETARPLSTT